MRDMKLLCLNWKHERPELPSNGQTAEKCLHTVQKKLMQDEKVAQVYQSVVDDYLLG